MKKLSILLILFTIISCSGPKFTGYEIVPMQTRNGEPCEFEVWETYDDGSIIILTRQDFCKYEY